MTQWRRFWRSPRTLTTSCSGPATWRSWPAEGNDLYILCTHPRRRRRGRRAAGRAEVAARRVSRGRDAIARRARSARARSGSWTSSIRGWRSAARRWPSTPSRPTFCAALAEQIGALKPDVVITHGSNGEYGHPQHVYTHRAVRRRWARWRHGSPSEFLTWCANDGRDAEPTGWSTATIRPTSSSTSRPGSSASLRQRGPRQPARHVPAEQQDRRHWRGAPASGGVPSLADGRLPRCGGRGAARRPRGRQLALTVTMSET